MLSFKALAVGAALAAIGYAQNVQITGRLQAKSPELGTVYVYKQANDGESVNYARLGSESQGHRLELRSDGLITNLDTGFYLNIQENYDDEKSFAFRNTASSAENGWTLADGNRLVSNGNKWGYQDEFQACKYSGGQYYVYLITHVVDNMECHSLGGLFFV
ncbi:hypothetical protein V2G26_012649 [Clonostachys chloroleuca]|uniref:Uncharacterized protein n=1 Tax=Clonostachys chloroleuca TaxID=1926264 RepID=A0AA35QBP0_9HYPO|nr:unnamed protein product [Clonostachys chloroleuca]